MTAFGDFAGYLQWTAWTVTMAVAGTAWLVILVLLGRSRSTTLGELYYAPFHLATEETLQVWYDSPDRDRIRRFLRLDDAWAITNAVILGLAVATVAAEVSDGGAFRTVGEAFTIMVIAYLGVDLVENRLMGRMLSAFEDARKTSWVSGNLVAHLNVAKWTMVAAALGYVSVGVARLWGVGFGLGLGALSLAFLAAVLVPGIRRLGRGPGDPRRRSAGLQPTSTR